MNNHPSLPYQKEKRTMMEYEIENKATGEICYVYGYNWKDACQRRGIIPDEWYVRYAVYVD